VPHTDAETLKLALFVTVGEGDAVLEAVGLLDDEHDGVMVVDPVPLGDCVLLGEVVADVLKVAVSVADTEAVTLPLVVKDGDTVIDTLTVGVTEEDWEGVAVTVAVKLPDTEGDTDTDTDTDSVPDTLLVPETDKDVVTEGVPEAEVVKVGVGDGVGDGVAS
jgi:hypothetical protein